MTSSQKKFAVVEFKEENKVTVIPTTWLINSFKAKWPSTPPTMTRMFIKKCWDPLDGWKIVDVAKIHDFSNSFHKAKRKAAILEVSQLSSDSEEYQRPRRHKRQKPLRYRSSDESSNSENDSIISKKKQRVSNSSQYLDKSSNSENDSIISKKKQRVSNSSQYSLMSGVTEGDQNYSATPGSQTVASVADIQVNSTSTAVYTHLFQCLENMKKQLKEMNSKLDRVISQVEKNTTPVENTPMISIAPPDFELPVTTENDLEQLNEKVKGDKEFASDLIRYLYTVGNGKTACSFILSLTRKVLAQELASQFSRLGRKGKKPFSVYNELMNAIIAAAALKFKDTDKDVFLEYFGKALAGAFEWNGRPNRIRPHRSKNKPDVDPNFVLKLE